jgi:hypothetical protein
MVKEKASKQKVSKVKSQVVKDSLSTDVSESSMKPTKKRSVFKTLVLILFLALLAAFLYLSKSLFVVAVVNGKPVFTYTLIKQLEKQYGKTVLDDMVAKELVKQTIRQEKAEPSAEDIKTEIDKIVKNLETQGTTLDAALTKEGITQKQLEETIAVQKGMEKILQSELVVTEDEIKKYFTENKTAFGKDAKFEDFEESIKSQLSQDKMSAAFQTWYTKLKSDSDIKYFTSF